MHSQHALNPVRGTPYDQGVPLTQSGSARASRAAAPAARSAPPCPHPSRGGSWPGTHALTLRAGKHASAQRGSQSLYESGLRMQLLMQRLAQPRTQHFRYAPDTRGPAPTRAQLQRLHARTLSAPYKHAWRCIEEKTAARTHSPTKTDALARNRPTPSAPVCTRPNHTEPVGPPREQGGAGSASAQGAPVSTMQCTRPASLTAGPPSARWRSCTSGASRAGAASLRPLQPRSDRLVSAVSAATVSSAPSCGGRGGVSCPPKPNCARPRLLPTRLPLSSVRGHAPRERALPAPEVGPSRVLSSTSARAGPRAQAHCRHSLIYGF